MGVFGKMQDVHYPSSGAVAQLGERDVRNVEVRGSIPLGSTTSLHHQKIWYISYLRGAFSY